MRKYKQSELNRYTDNTYSFFKYMLDKPITSKVLRLAAELNEATNNELAMALILSNKYMLFGDDLQYFNGKWGDIPNAESNSLINHIDPNICMKRSYLKEENHDSMTEYESHTPHFTDEKYDSMNDYESTIKHFQDD